MEYLLPIFGAVSLLFTLPGLFRLRRFVRKTTLTAAWNWAFALWLMWAAAWLATVIPIPVSLKDHVWYAVAVLGLCPPISVLGAKRPGSRVWTAFVVLPLLLVFAWPALVGWVHGFPPQRLELETPMLLGYCLVLVMGYGNYLGTRSSLPALFFALALGWLVWEFGDMPDEDERLSPVGPTVLFIIGSLFGTFLTSSRPENPKGWDRVWRDFQEAFGIVWAKRVMDRINHTARHEKWSARLDMAGLIWDKDITPEQTQDTLSRIDHTFRWLLRRFVDPEWIEERLKTGKLCAKLSGGRENDDVSHYPEGV